MIEELFTRFEGAFAENTIKAYRADFNQFSQWCCGGGIDPLVARPEDLVAYIKWKMQISSSGSIERAVAGIGTVYRLSDRPDITKPDGAPRKLMDNTKLNNSGWKSRYDLKSGLQYAYTWYMKHIATERQ